MPKVLEAATSILMEYLRTEKKERLYSDKPWTNTRCQEKVEGYQTAVGRFDPDGLYVCRNIYAPDYYGVAALRKFF